MLHYSEKEFGFSTAVEIQWTFFLFKVSLRSAPLGLLSVYLFLLADILVCLRGFYGIKNVPFICFWHSALSSWTIQSWVSNLRILTGKQEGGPDMWADAVRGGYGSEATLALPAFVCCTALFRCRFKAESGSDMLLVILHVERWLDL